MCQLVRGLRCIDVYLKRIALSRQKSVVDSPPSALSASSMPLLPANPAVRAPDLQEDEVTCVACVDKRSVGLGRNKRDQNAGSSSSSSSSIRSEGFDYEMQN